MTEFSNRVRGIVRARAEAPTLGEINAKVLEIHEVFAAFKAANDERLKGIEKGRDDVVTNEKVDRINADVTSLTKVIDGMKETVEAMKLGGGATNGLRGNVQTPERKQYASTFNTWFRKGGETVEAGLKNLAVKAALSSQSDADGGFLLPEEMDSTITRVVANLSAMRGIARVVSTSSYEYKTLVSQGGATSGWVGEEASRTTTNTPTLSEISVPAGEIYANCFSSQRMLDDASVNIEQWLADEVAITFAEQEGAAFISGNGVNRPMGFLSYSPVANASYAWGRIGYIATGTSGAFATAGADNLISLHYALRPGYRSNGTFIMSDVTLGTVRAFKDTTNQYIWAPPTADAPASILGKPVVTDENMPTIAANSYSVAFGDFNRGYLINDRLQARVLRDPYTNKPYVNFYTTKRVGGGVVNFEAIKTLKFGTS
jgi:HK97 family phage major capsid protein